MFQTVQFRAIGKGDHGYLNFPILVIEYEYFVVSCLLGEMEGEICFLLGILPLIWMSNPFLHFSSSIHPFLPFPFSLFLFYRHCLLSFKEFEVVFFFFSFYISSFVALVGGFMVAPRLTFIFWWVLHLESWVFFLGFALVLLLWLCLCSCFLPYVFVLALCLLGFWWFWIVFGYYFRFW